MTKLKLIRHGDALGVVLPEAVLQDLNAGEGDELRLEKHDGGYTLSRAHGDIVQTGLKAFERTRQKFDNAFRELAK